MSIEALVPWVSAAALIMTIANFVWVWSAQSRTATATKLNEVECDVEGHDKRIQSIESELKHLPTKEEISDLKLQLTEVVGQLRVAESEMASAVRTIRRIDDHLRESRV